MNCKELIEELVKNKEFSKWDDLKNCIDDLIRSLSSESCNVRKRIVYAMGVLQLKFGINLTDYLKKSLNDECPWVRGFAAEALGKLDISDDTIIKLLKDRCPWVRHRAANALITLCKDSTIAKKAYKPLIERLNDSSPYVQYHAIQALKSCIEALKDEKDAYRIEEAIKSIDVD